jgi:hypothetical protein
VSVEILEGLSVLLSTLYCGTLLRIAIMGGVALVATTAFVMALIHSLWTGDYRIWQVALWIEGAAAVVGVFSPQFRRQFAATPAHRVGVALALFFAPLVAAVFLSLFQN